MSGKRQAQEYARLTRCQKSKLSDAPLHPDIGAGNHDFGRDRTTGRDELPCAGGTPPA